MVRDDFGWFCLSLVDGLVDYLVRMRTFLVWLWTGGVCGLIRVENWRLWTFRILLDN